MSVPFIRKKSPEELDSHIRLARVKWQKLAARLEAILRKNGGVYLVGESLSYADVLVGHLTTWFVEEVYKLFLLFIFIHFLLFNFNLIFILFLVW